jgi:hypothetical protein
LAVLGPVKGKNTMMRGATSLLTAVFVTSGLALFSSPASGAPAWKKLYGVHANVSRKGLVRQMKRDGVRAPAKLLKQRYLLRLEIRNAGGGSAKHSEVVVRFRSRPARVHAKAWSPGGRQRTAAQLGAWAKCKTKRNGVGRSCPLKYNGRGFRDVTASFTDRNMLFVHDPKRKGSGNTVVWFASERSQKYLWFYVVPKTAWPSYGSPRVRVKKYLVPKAAPPARLPGTPPDPGNPTLRPRPNPPIHPPVKVHPCPVNRWTTATNLHRALSKAKLARRMRADGVASPAYMLTHRYLLRVALTKAGGGSRSRAELLLRLKSRPKKALGKAWSDRREMRRAQIGANGRCRTLPRRQGGPEGRRCPVHFNALGWRNLISAFTSSTMRIVSDPNNPRQGNVVLWLAFNESQSGLSHKFVLRSSLPTFGKGNVSLGFFAVSDGSGITPTRPVPPTTPAAGWKALGTSSHRAATRASLTTRMRRDGVRSPAYLLKYRYLVRLSLTGVGGGRSNRSEVVVKMSSRPRAALGTAWSDHRRRGGAQLGTRKACRALPRARNPYHGTSPMQRHACPMQYNGLGWRNLISAFTSTEMMFVTAPRRRGGGNQVLWLAYNMAQTLSYQPAVNTPAHRTSAGSVRAEKFVLGSATTTPHAGGGHVWKNRSGAHQYVNKKNLAWQIRRDGFTNPWYLLKKRYLVRLRITAASQRSYTVLRFANIPGMAIGRGVAARSNRSAVQTGTVAGCKAAAGRRPHCPLHFGNLGWRNLSTGMQGKDLLFVNIPLGFRQSAVTTVWLAFDNPQSLIRQRFLKTARGKASVSIKRYRW